MGLCGFHCYQSIQSEESNPQGCDVVQQAWVTAAGWYRRVFPSLVGCSGGVGQLSPALFGVAPAHHLELADRHLIAVHLREQV